MQGMVVVGLTVEELSNSRYLDLVTLTYILAAVTLT